MAVCESLEDFFVATTVVVAYRITVTDIDDVSSYPDISGDAVRMILKVNQDDDDDDAVLDVAADVTTDGANGYAIFNLTPEETNIAAASYYFEVIWTIASAGGVHPLDGGTVAAKRRIADV